MAGASGTARAARSATVPSAATSMHSGAPCPSTFTDTMYLDAPADIAVKRCKPWRVTTGTVSPKTKGRRAGGNYCLFLDV